MPYSLDRRGRLVLAGFLLAMSVLYLATLDNGLRPGELAGGDLITHQYAQVQARPANAPGYPLYTLGGWLWVHGWRTLAQTLGIAIHPVAVLGAYSTLWALIALTLLFLLLYDVTGSNLIITCGITLFYGVTYFFWYYSVTTEQYTSAVAQTLAVALLVHRWDAHRRDGYLYGLALLLGLCLAHLVTVLFMAPGVLLFLLTREPGLWRRGRLVGRGVLLALAPLLSYSFIYLRGAQHPEWRGAGTWPSTWAWFLDFLSTRQGRAELTWTLGPLAGGFPELMIAELTPLLLVCGVVGWGLLGRAYGLFYGLTALIYLVFGYIDRLGNWYQVLMPLYPLVLVGSGVTLARVWSARADRLWRGALVLLLAALIVPKAIESYPRADQRNRPEDTGLQPGETILAAQPPPGAAVLGTVEEKLALDYLTIIAGRRPDLTALTTAQAAARLAQGEIVFVTPAAALYAAAATGLPLRYTAWSPGLLAAGAGHVPDVHPGDVMSVDRDVGDGLRLVGYRWGPGPHPGQWDVTLWLQATRTPTGSWALSLRLLNGETELAQQDHPAPALGFQPTDRLVPGETVADAFRFDLPAEAVPTGFRLILYRPLSDGRFLNLTVLDIAPGR
ncbi:MAG: DUF2723 domain-containing protein [Anaerolineae bacterium]|nr:DUF2723 domain-containing protein [Anaerolineae bacterium]